MGQEEKVCLKERVAIPDPLHGARGLALVKSTASGSALLHSAMFQRTIPPAIYVLSNAHSFEHIFTCHVSSMDF
jgi:hypothetical protein